VGDHLGDHFRKKASAPRASKRPKRSAATAKGARPWKLYWCTTPDHDEDWFIIARTSVGARRCHENAEGYDSGTAEAEYVCDVPARFVEGAPGWPSDAALKACGGEFLKRGVRVVRIAGRVFGEGDIVGNVGLEARRIRRH
jgi:hypothetical protein